MTEYMQQEIRRQAIMEAYRLVEKFIEWNDKGGVEWQGRPMRCLAQLMVMSDSPVPPVQMQEEKKCPGLF